jgi:uncharacterized protein
MSTAAFDPAASQQPLGDAELDELGELLAADWASGEAMDLEQLDGFLAGLICAPRVVLPSAYVPAIFGDAEPEFPDLATAQRFFALLMRRHNEIAAALNAPIERLDDPRAYEPYLIDWDDNKDIARQMVEAGELPRIPAYGELWASGFLHAVHLTQEDWKAVPEGDEDGAQLVDDSLSSILALVPDDDEADAATGATSDERDARMADALIAVYDLRHYWRDVQFERDRNREPVRREAKVGRNDPCPCGSGKKFKLCHGREH